MGAELFSTLAYAFAMLLRLMSPAAEGAGAPVEYVVYVAPPGGAVEAHRLAQNRDAWEFYAPDSSRYGVLERSRYFGEHYVVYPVGSPGGEELSAPLPIDLTSVLREVPTDDSFVYVVEAESVYSGWIIQRLDDVFYVRAPTALLWALPRR